MSTPKRLFAKKSLITAMLGIAACAALCFGAGTAYAAPEVSALGIQAGGTVTTVPAYGNDATNTSGKANIRTVYRFGWVSGGNNNAKEGVRKNLDVTGDGYADTIKVMGTRTSKTSGYLKKIKVTVNAEYVRAQLNEDIHRKDVRKYIL